jgi:hypothetical protein
MIDVCHQIYIQKSISISWKLPFHEEHSATTMCLLPNWKNVGHSIQFTLSLCSCKLCHVFGKRHRTSCVPIPILFVWCSMVSIDKLINDWTLDYVYRVDICNLCVPLFPCGRNQQPRLLFDMYNIYINLKKPMIWYK